MDNTDGLARIGHGQHGGSGKARDQSIFVGLISYMPKNKMQAANAPVAAGAVPRDGDNSLASYAAAPPGLGVYEGPAFGRAYMDLSSRFLFPNNTELSSPLRSRQQTNRVRSCAADRRREYQKKIEHVKNSETARRLNGSLLLTLN